MSNATPVLKVLIFAAGPSDEAPLRLGREVREVENCLRQSRFRDRFAVDHSPAVRADDLQERMLEARPSVVHFSGHGSGDAGLVLEDDAGRGRPVPTGALAGLFQLFAGQVRLVVLNACYSEVQAKAIAEHVPFVVGMAREVGDAAAIDFAAGFYAALFAGEPVERAFEFGRNRIHLETLPDAVKAALADRNALPDGEAPAERLPEHLKPVLLVGEEAAWPSFALVRARWLPSRRAALAAAGGLAAAAGVGVWVAVREPVKPPDVESVAAALRAQYREIDRRTTGAGGVQSEVLYRRLRAAVFLTHPACGGNADLLVPAGRWLDNVGFFQQAVHPDAAADLDRLEAELHDVLRQRLVWLESDVLPALDRSRSADVPLPRVAAVDLKNPASVGAESFARRPEAEREVGELGRFLGRNQPS